jgi:hypothetical protein
MYINNTILYTLAVLFSLFASYAAAEKRVYQTDKFGNIQHHLPSYTIENNGRIVETDKFGNKQYHKQQRQIQGNKIYQTDKFGNIQYNKPSMTIKNN